MSLVTGEWITSQNHRRAIDTEFAVIIKRADDGSFSAWVPDLPGCVSTEDTRDEAIQSIAEAIRSHVETLRSLGEPVPTPRSSAASVRAA